MNKKKETSGNGFFDIIIYGMMIVAVVYVIIQCILGNNDTLHFKLTLGIWIVLAVAVADFVGPAVMGRFNDIPSKSVTLYTIYSIMDALMYMGLYVFVINISMTKEPLHYIFLGIAVVFFAVKTPVYKKFEKSLKDIPDSGRPDDEETDDVEVDTLREEDEDDIKILVYRNK